MDARDSISGVKQVLFDVKRVKNPDPKDPLEFVLADPKPVPRLPNGAYQLAHAFEKAGDHALYFQVIDNSGNKNEPKEVPIEVQKVPMNNKAPAVPANQLGSISGVAKVEGGRGNILRVTLNRGDKEIKGVDKPRDGQFAFEKIPPGDYELKVHGNYGGQTKVSKPSPVTVEPGKPSQCRRHNAWPLKFATAPVLTFDFADYSTGRDTVTWRSWVLFFNVSRFFDCFGTAFRSFSLGNRCSQIGDSRPRIPGACLRLVMQKGSS